MFTTAFLLFLQGIRESAGVPLNSFFMSCTDFGNVNIILFLIAILYRVLEIFISKRHQDVSIFPVNIRFSFMLHGVKNILPN